MANINGNEIYFGIIGDVGTGTAPPVATATIIANGVKESVVGTAEFSEIEVAE